MRQTSDSASACLNLTIATPCPADWEEMSGDEKVRFCQHCQLNVYNLSNMTLHEAGKLVQQQEGRLCVRFYQRADGTVLTQDCPVGLQVMHSRRILSERRSRHLKTTSAGVLVTLVTVAGIFSSFNPSHAHDAKTSQPQNHTVPAHATMGERIIPSQTVLQGDVAAPSQKSPTAPVMGAPAVLPSKSPKQPPEHPSLMGKPVMKPGTK